MKLQVKNLTLLVLGLVLVCGAQILSSCEKDPIPSGPEELQPTLVVSKTPEGVLPYGSKGKIFWKTTNANLLTVNGVRQGIPTNDSVFTERMFESTLFEIKATNRTLSVQKEVEFHVGDWKTSKFGLITHTPWYMTANKCYRDGVLLVSFVLSEIEKTDQHVYSIDGKFSVYRSGVRIGYMDWGFSPDENILYHGPGLNSPSSEKLTIAYLGEKKLIFRDERTYADGKPCLAEATFERN